MILFSWKKALQFLLDLAGIQEVCCLVHVFFLLEKQLQKWDENEASEGELKIASEMNAIAGYSQNN